MGKTSQAINKKTKEVPMSDANTNVVLFPFARLARDDGITVTPPQTIEEVYDRVVGLRQLHVQECMEPITDILVQQLMISGFDVSPDEFAKDITFLVEALRSVMMKSMGVWHPFQELAESTFTRTNDHDAFDLAEEIKLKFTKGVVGSKIQPDAPAEEPKQEKKTRKKKTKA